MRVTDTRFSSLTRQRSRQKFLSPNPLTVDFLVICPPSEEFQFHKSRISLPYLVKVCGLLERKVSPLILDQLVVSYPVKLAEAFLKDPASSLSSHRNEVRWGCFCEESRVSPERSKECARRLRTTAPAPIPYVYMLSRATLI